MMVRAKACIWCKEQGQENAQEHIIPEPLGCPDHFVLRNGEVCKSCNNGTAHLDKAVVDEYEIHVFMSGIRRKRDRRPVISSRGNLIGKHTSEGKSLFINLNRYRIAGPEGIVIGPLGGSKRNIKADLKIEGNLAQVSFDIPFGCNDKFVRGIYKIAFESMAFFLGTDTALNDNYDSTRDFVLSGKGQRKILLLQCEDRGYCHEIKPPHYRNPGETLIEMRLGVMNYLVDLSPHMTIFPDLIRESEKLYGNSGWTYLPIGASAPPIGRTRKS